MDRHGATALLTKGHLSEGCVVDSPRLCLRTFVQTLTEPVSGTFPLPRAGYIRDRDPVFLRINTHNHSLAGLVCV